jgi:thymidylate synthase
MSQLDKIYDDLIRDVLENGVDKDDRTGTGTRSVFGRQIRFDVDLDNFPIVTEKKIIWDSLLTELVWMVQGQTNTAYLNKHDVSIWNDWANSKTNRASNVYGKQWRRWEVDGKKVIEVKKRKGPKKGEVIIPEFENKSVVDNNDLCGKTFENDQNQKFQVIEKTGVQNGNSIYTIQFEDSNSVLKNIQRPRIRYGEVKDPYNPSVKGIGCIGRPNHKNEDWYERAYNMWNSMLGRCYDKCHPSYDSYGGKGVYVSPRWKNFELFIEDIKDLPFFDEWLNGENYCLDKDYYGSNCYSKKTCLFLSEEENKLYQSNTPIIVNNKNIFITQKEFAKKHNLDSKRVSEQVRKENTRYPEWSIEKYKNKDKVVRYKRVVDQLSRTIENIRNKPDSRRHLVSAWNPSQLDEMALPPCHWAFQFYSRPTDSGKRELSIKVSQRSCDLFIGWSFNMSSYATLLAVVAEITDHDPGEMIWSGGDVHLYQNHLDKAKKVLDLPHYEAPELEISNSLKEIDDFRRQSVRLVDYEHGPFVKAPIAV